MFGIDFCDVKMKSRYQLKFSKKTLTLHAVTAEVIELNNRKNLKKTSFISSQRTIMKHETRVAKSEKVFKNYTGSNASWKSLFF